MRTVKNRFDILVAIVAFALLAACQSNRPGPIDEPSEQEGLVRVETKAANAVYRRPGITLTGYDRLLLRPIDVQFAKNWDPKSTGSVLYQMKPADSEKIKSELAQAFADVLKVELEKGGYPLVTEPAADVLEIRAAIVNLYVTAPDASMQTGGRSKTYTTDAGEMSLILELHDSVTGELLGRAYDRRTASRGTWTWTTSVSNSVDAKRILSSWATALRSVLDASRAAS